MKKLIPILITFFLLSGCSSQPAGKMQHASNDTPLLFYNDSNQLIFDIEPMSVDGYDIYYDYNAGFSFPYPKGWSVNEYSANYILINGPDAQITISHNAVPSDAFDSLSSFKSCFNSDLKNDYIVLDGDSFYRRDNQIISSAEVVSREPLLFAETFDNLKVSNDVNDFVSGEYCEKRYYMHYNDMNSFISVTGKKSDVYDIADCVVSNLRTVEVSYDKSKSISGVIVPESFESVECEIDNINGHAYVPVGNDAFSGCFVQVYDGAINLTENNLNNIFTNAFGISFDNGYNHGDNLLFENIGDGTPINVTIRTDALYDAVKTGNDYRLEVYQSDNGIVVIGYPVVKERLMEKLSDYKQ